MKRMDGRNLSAMQGVDVKTKKRKQKPQSRDVKRSAPIDFFF